MHKMTARLIEHHSVLVVDPQSAQVELDGSIARIVLRMLGIFAVVTALSFPPVSNSLVSWEPETVRRSLPPFELNMSPIGCLLKFCGGDLAPSKSRDVPEPSIALSMAFRIAWIQDSMSSFEVA